MSMQSFPAQIDDIEGVDLAPPVLISIPHNRSMSIGFKEYFVDDFAGGMPGGGIRSFETLSADRIYRPANFFTYNYVDEWPVSNEFQDLMNEVCFEFCNAHGLMPALRLCVRAIRNLFSNITEIQVELDHFEDDETPDDGHIVFRILTKSDQQTVMNEYNNWINWIVDTIEEDKQSLITLTID